VQVDVKSWSVEHAAGEERDLIPRSPNTTILCSLPCGVCIYSPPPANWIANHGRPASAAVPKLFQAMDLAYSGLRLSRMKIRLAAPSAPGSASTARFSSRAEILPFSTLLPGMQHAANHAVRAVITIRSGRLHVGNVSRLVQNLESFDCREVLGHLLPGSPAAWQGFLDSCTSEYKYEVRVRLVGVVQFSFLQDGTNTYARPGLPVRRSGASVALGTGRSQTRCF
jgi:hypothetical protein